MKRSRSFDEDLDAAAAAEKGGGKDWGRRDPELERPSSSSLHRRFYLKGLENGRKGSLASPSSVSATHDRNLDDDRDGGSRSSRKQRIDHEPDGFDRRKGFDRYRESGGDRSGGGGDRMMSPRGGYGGERMHRSESFSASSTLRREFPKGIRSDRDRLRREEARRRSGSSNRDSEGEPRFVSDRGNHRALSGDRGASAKSPPAVPPGKDVVKSPQWSKESGGERSKFVEPKKAEEVHVKSGNSSDMEEGELVPEPQLPPPDPAPELEVQPVKVVSDESDKQLIAERNVGSEFNLEEEVKLAEAERLGDKEEDNGGIKGFCDGDRKNGGTESAIAEEIDREIASPGETENGNIDANVSEEKDEMIDANVCEEKGEMIDANVSEEKDEMIDANVSEEKEGEKRDDQGVVPSSGKEDKIEKTGVEISLSVELKPKEGRGFDLELDAEDVERHDLHNYLGEENHKLEVALKLMTDKLNEGSGKDKGKSLAISLSNEADSGNRSGCISKERDDTLEGPSNRGLELFLHSDVARRENVGSSHHSKSKNDKLKMEPLDLSLGLPNVLPALPSNDYPRQAPNSPSHGRSTHSLPTTYYTQSDGFTASVSFSGSQTFVHNPSCSLTHNLYDNYEHSVGSHPIFQGVDQVSQGIWQGQSSNDPKRKDVLLYQKILQNGSGIILTPQASNGILNGRSGSTGIPILDRQASLHRQLSGNVRHEESRSPTQSIGSYDARSEHSRDKRRVLKERNGSGVLFRTSQGDMEKILITSPGVAERIVAKVVRDPLPVMARRIQEIPDHSLSYLKEIAGQIIGNEAKFRSLQEVLHSRSDLQLETLSNCHRVQLEILVAVKTGLREFLHQAINVPSTDLVEIFLDLKCRNLACQSILPVDECDCKVCRERNGFCSACMCIICSKFDMASNTCSWVGCDVCVHWCHTDCALQGSHIRNGRSVNGPHGTTEMQFFCVACGHPSEIFGFVKDVFKTCAKDWKAEILCKELEYVRRIFRASEDARGRQLYDVASKMLERAENKSSVPEMYNCIMSFLSESESKINKVPAFSVEAPQKNLGERSNGAVGPSQESMWLRSASTEKAPIHTENANGVAQMLDWGRVTRQSEAPKLQLNSEKKPVFDELESIVRIKQAEAKMFQTRADDATREADNLKCIAIAKNKKIEEEYQSRIRKLNLVEAEERRRQKLEELQVLERAHREYFNMKARMESDIKDLLLKMEATKRNLST